MAKISDRIKHAWNAFTSEQERTTKSAQQQFSPWYGSSTSVRPDRPKMFFSNERSIISAIYTRIAIDFASIGMRHVRLDDQGRYKEDIKSGLNECLTVEANIDQAARAFRQDQAMSLCGQGSIAIVPVETTQDPEQLGGWDVKNMRIGYVTMWYPKHVKVAVYNEATGIREEVTLEKKMVAIVENPLYAIMNQPNSTLQRLLRKLSLLDSVDEASASGKLDLIIQLPYVVKTEQKREQAKQRKADLEVQLKGSEYGIAYTDINEKITQLNRPAENNLMAQVEYLMNLLYTQLGLTPEVMNGTADEAAMINYFNRTIKPMLDSVQEAMVRTFLTKTARSQGQTILYFRDPFELVPVSELAEIADKLTRNEIVSSNEFRGFLGMKPSNDPKADALQNSNVPAPAEAGAEQSVDDGGADAVNSAFDEVDSSLDEMINSLEVPDDDEQAS